MNIFVDIDETICFYEGERSYPDATPWYESIAKINKLYDEGHHIVYWTARGSATGVDWKDLTEKQLSDWGVKHHELRMGKPSYDLLICDKTDRIENI
jgi:dTDP-glucose 4,6-dehydratase